MWSVWDTDITRFGNSLASSGTKRFTKNLHADEFLAADPVHRILLKYKLSPAAIPTYVTSVIELTRRMFILRTHSVQ